MATKAPLVLGSDGRPQQLQSGDTLSTNSATNQIVQTAGATLIAGQAVYSSGNDTVNKGQANGATTSRLLGLAIAAITNAATGAIQQSGVLALTTGQWDALAGTTGGLAANTTYYLNPSTAGNITGTCPTATGQYVVIVGTAISTTELNIRITEPILL